MLSLPAPVAAHILLRFLGQMVRVVLDNVNNDMLAAFDGRMMPPFDPYNNRADVVRFTSKIVATMTNPNR